MKLFKTFCLEFKLICLLSFQSMCELYSSFCMYCDLCHSMFLVQEKTKLIAMYLFFVKVYPMPFVI